MRWCLLALAGCLTTPSDVRFACEAAADCDSDQLCLGGVCETALHPYLGDPRHHSFDDIGFGGAIELYRFSLVDIAGAPLPGTVATTVHFCTRNADTDPRVRLVVYQEQAPTHLVKLASADGIVVEDAWTSAPISVELASGAAYWLGYAAAGSAPDRNELAATVANCGDDPAFAAPYQCASGYYYQLQDPDAPLPETIDVSDVGQHFSPSLYLDAN